MTYLFLAIVAAIAVWSILKDPRDMAKLKSAPDTTARQRILTRWMVQSWAVFGLAAVAGLALTGNLARLTDPILHLVDFDLVNSHGAGFVAGLVAASLILVGLVAGQIVSARRKARHITLAEFEKMKTRYMVGDIAALIPKNAAERRIGAGLSLAAGVNEELMFRALLPALIFDACGGRFVWVAIAVSVVVFGLLHFYQGVAGVIGTTFLGAILMAIYLGTGNIFAPMAVHFLIDLRSLVLTSWIFETAAKTISRLQGASDGAPGV
jgi:membrane protease YdiL (CAAX protease family)